MGLVTKFFLQGFKPKPILTVSEWADRHRFLTTETSSVAGQWRTSFTPYLKEPMDTCSSPDYKHVVLMFASQLGKSEALNNVSGFYIDQEPSPQMIVQPTLTTAKEYSQIRISPMIKASPSLAEKVIEDTEENKKKGGKDKPSMFYKPFPSGYLVLSGANSAASLASKPIRILLRDEIDRFPDNIAGEGSPLELSEQRTRTFFNKKIVDSSTPLVSGESKIEVLYEKSDKRNYFVPCPHCNHMQTLDFKLNVVWEKEGTNEERSKTAKIICVECGETMKGAGRADSDWIGLGEWRKTAVSDIAGFYLSALYSPLISLQEIVLKWLEAIHSKDEEQKQVFYNLMLGLPYKRKTYDTKEYAHFYEKRREYYEGEIPDKVCALTVGVDTQDNRLEAELVGWGKGFESWGIEYRVFLGSPDEPKVWQELDEWLMRERQFKSGGKIGVSAALIDTGGHHATDVYRFTSTRESRRIFSIKGTHIEGPFIGKAKKTNYFGAHRFDIYVDAGKSKLWTRIHEENEGTGYCHFNRKENSGYDEEYFKMLLSERYQVKIVNGKEKRGWFQIRDRNEAWDVRNYAQAAIELIVPTPQDMDRLDQMIDRGTGSHNTNANNTQQQQPRRKLSSGINL